MIIGKQLLQTFRTHDIYQILLCHVVFKSEKIKLLRDFYSSRWNVVRCQTQITYTYKATMILPCKKIIRALAGGLVNSVSQFKKVGLNGIFCKWIY